MPKNEGNEYYRARAPEYEQIYYRDDAQRRSELEAEAATLRKVTEGKNVLELACGTGYWTKIMSEVAISITAVDLAPQAQVISRS